MRSLSTNPANFTEASACTAEADLSLPPQDSANVASECSPENSAPAGPPLATESADRRPPIKIEGECVQLSLRYAADLQAAIGERDLNFSIQRMGEIAKMSSETASANGIFWSLRGLRPQSPAQAMLASHMAALDALIVDFVGRLSNAQTAQEMALYETTLNKLSRTYVYQYEALHRSQSASEHRAQVQNNVLVTGGAQAIIGDVTQNGEVATNNDDATQPLIKSDRHSARPPKRGSSK